jgi:RNA polymerase sigma-70 factor (ECF subfamily)
LEVLGENMARPQIRAQAARKVTQTDAAGRAGVSGSAAEAAQAVDFDELYRREYRPLVALAYGLSGSRAAAEEIVQDAFLAAHRKWRRISTYDAPGLWLRRVVANRSVSTVRRRIAEARALTRLGGWASRQQSLPEQHDELWRAVRRLPDQQAKAVLLRYVDDCTVAQTAAILGCTEGTVKTHLHRARRSLAGALPQHAPRSDG